MTKFLRNMSVKLRLAIFVSFLLALIAVAGLGGLLGMRDSNNSLSEVYMHEVLPLKELREIDNLFQSNVVSIVDKTLFEQISFSEAAQIVENTRIQLLSKWTRLQQDSEDGNNVDTSWMLPAKPLVPATDEITGKLVEMLKKSDIDAIDPFTDEELYPLADEYRKIINQLVQNRLDTVKHEYEKAQDRFRFSKIAFTITLLIGFAISIIASYFLIRGIDVPLNKILEAMKHVIRGDLTQQLEFGRHDEFGLLIKGFNRMVTYLRDLVSQIQRSGIQVTSSITELAATNKQQEVTANEHAATASEIAASTTEIAATGANLMNTMKRVHSLTKNAAFAAEEGHAGLADIDRTMVKMEEATGGIVTKLSILSEKAGNIAGVVKTINKVADQTNLLSLNAAIEAEKAGEYGTGFAVVATEIRRLADQTAVATFDIEQMVQEVQSAISAAVMGIDKFADDAHRSVEKVRTIGEQLTGVIEQVEVLNPQVESLTDGIEAQTLGAKQISESISQLNDAAQQTAESISQTSASVAQLHQAALLLQEGASRFKVDTDSCITQNDEDEDNASSSI